MARAWPCRATGELSWRGRPTMAATTTLRWCATPPRARWMRALVAAARLTTAIGNSDDYGQSVAVQSDGKILLAGYSYPYNGSNYDFALVRYTAAGALDTGSGSNPGFGNLGSGK